MSDLDSYRNGILMVEALETQFDKKRVAFSYEVLHDALIFHIIDPKLTHQKIHKLDIAFGSLENTVLVHPPGKMPFRRLIAWHYAAALEQARAKGWRSDASLPQLPAVPRDVVSGWLHQVLPEAKWPRPVVYARAVIDETRRASDDEQ